MLIIRRSKLYYTASGIITPVGGRPVHRCASYGRPSRPLSRLHKAVVAASGTDLII